jgi:uncharacterized membrane protein
MIASHFQKERLLSGRRTILILLALNLFFAGVAAAFFARLYWNDASSHAKGSPARRIETLAGLLSSEDAAILRLEFTKRSEAIDQASENFQKARDLVRASLRAEPFDLAATQTAMAEAEAAHARIDQMMQEVIAFAAVKMSAEGRRNLADWPRRDRRGSGETKARLAPSLILPGGK